MKIFHLPDLGEGLEEAEVREWYVKVNDIVKIDQPLLSVETAKAVVDIPSPQTGTIAKLYGQPGEFIKTHAPLIEFVGDETPIAIEIEKGNSIVGKIVESDVILREDSAIIGAPPRVPSSVTVKALPAVRQLAKQLQVDLSIIIATGPDGHITEADVKKQAEKKSPAATEKVLHGTRHFMAIAMANAHREVVPVTLVDDADITNWPQEQDITVTLIQAIIAAIRTGPTLNAWYDSKTNMRTLHQDVQLGLAVDTADGLFVPVIQQADKKSAERLRQDIQTFKQQIQTRTVARQDLQGATITLSNFGNFAGRYGTVMVMPPTVAIIGCGQIRDAVMAYQGKMEIRRIAPISLTFDHRVVTGGEGAKFLAALLSYLAKPI